MKFPRSVLAALLLLATLTSQKLLAQNPYSSGNILIRNVTLIDPSGKPATGWSTS
jgi:hypothetical protein